MRLLISDFGKQQYLGSFPLFYKSKFMKWKKFNLYNKLRCMLKKTDKEKRKTSVIASAH